MTDNRPFPGQRGIPEQGIDPRLAAAHALVFGSTDEDNLPWPDEGEDQPDPCDHCQSACYDTDPDDGQRFWCAELERPVGECSR